MIETIEEKKAFVKNALSKLEALLRTPVSGFHTEEEVIAMDDAAEEIGYEFSWWSEDEGQKYLLRCIGFINGFLANQNKTLVMQYDEDTKDFVGIAVVDNTKFGEPI